MSFDRLSALQSAMALHQAGQLTDAEAAYRRLMKRLPGDADVLHLLGVCLGQIGNTAEGIKLIGQAIRRDRGQPLYHLNLARLREMAGDLAGALDAYGAAVALNPDPAIRLARAQLAFRLGRFADAATEFRAALAQNPAAAPLWNDLGCALERLGDDAPATAAFRTALAQDPGFAPAWSNVGRAQARRGGDARPAFARAVRLNPIDATAWNDIGRAQDDRTSLRRALILDPSYALAANNLAEAGGYIDWARRAVAADPAQASYHYNLGVALNRQGAFGEAAEAYRQAARRQPNDGRIWNNLATAEQAQGLHDRALRAFVRALALDPAMDEVWSNYGNALRDGGDPTAADHAYRRALKLDPDFAEARSSLIFSLNGDAAIDNARLGIETQAYESEHAARHRAAWPAAWKRPDGGGRLRIGYVSPDYRHHSCAWFLEPLFAAHDRAAVEVVAYAELRQRDDRTAVFKNLADRWVETRDLDDDALAARIQADGIDILVDLAGHTGGNRLGVFARKPAPVQVSWLGYNGAIGMTAIDWRLTDRLMAPDGSTEQFLEGLWRLDRPAHVYRPPADAPAIAARGDGPIVFGSFNNLSKLSAETVALWSATLRAVPDSRLFIKTRQAADPAVRAQLAARFAPHGIAADRLDFAPWTRTTADHLALYGAIDIGLDPFPYHGTTTTCEALWMGVPVISRQGPRMIARLGASLLDPVGLGHLAVTSDADFVAQAAALAADRGGLARLRRDLRANMAASALRDEAGFARALESAYRAMATR